MSKRFVIALIKHETNTFSPIATPLSAFGHGNGPSYGEDAKAAFAGSNTPFAAFLDIARREGGEAVTPIAGTFDYHTNLSPESVANATVITGYKTYPHVDMYAAGLLAGDILARSLRGATRPGMAWGRLPLVSSVMRH